MGIETKGLINISKEEAQKADAIAKECIQDKEGIIESIIRSYPKENQAEEREFALTVLEKIEPIYSNYIRQYVGYESDEGSRLVWINFFLEDDVDQDWKKVIIYPPLTSKRTDYHGFFQALIDLDAENCPYFKLGV